MVMNRVRAALAGALIATGAAAGAQRADPVPELAGPPIGPVTSEHRASIASQSISYRAVFREYVLDGEDGRPLATISATSYSRSDVPAGSARPLFFFFNGGPGASSSPLHFTAFGPRLRPSGRDQSAPFVDNPDSLLDVADLVFVDPVGTGFSRVLPGGDGRPFWAPRADAAAMLRLIRNWISDHQREASPIFIAGESYGAYRLATLMRDAADLNLHGLLLISPSTSTAGMAGAASGDLDHVLSLPSMAVAAWHHGKVDRGNETAEQYFARATAFAETEYLVALHQGSALEDSERRRIAERMSGLIGLDPDLLTEADLRVDNDLFVNQLLRGENQLVGRLDARVSAPVQPPARGDRPAAANDPSLGLGRSNVIRSEAITRYMRDELGVNPGRDYVSLTLDVNFNWNWFEPVEDRRAYHNPLGHVAAAMEARPDLRLMVAGGIYDLATPVASAHHAIRHSGIALDRVRFLALPAGHSPFEDPDNRRRFADEVRDFIASAR